MVEICLECGILSFSALIVNLLVCFNIISLYPKYKNKDFIYVGLALLLMFAPWWPSSISFIMYLFTREGLPIELYLIIGQSTFPFSLLFWILAMFNLFKTKISKQRLILIIYSVYLVIYEVLMIYWVLNPSQLGYLRNPLVPIYNNFVYVLLSPVLVAFFLAAFLFGLDSLKTKEPVIKLKGKFLILSDTLLLIGVLLEILTVGDTLLLVSRIIIASGMIAGYISFKLPKRVKKIFIKA